MRFLKSKNIFSILFFILGALLVLVIKLTVYSKDEKCLTNILVEKNRVDFDEITSLDQAYKKFEIVNTGSCDLVIDKVVADCHCTVPNWSKEPVKPMGRTFIDVQYDNYSLGFFQQKILVYCNIENSPFLLIIQGKVIPKPL